LKKAFFTILCAGFMALKSEAAENDAVSQLKSAAPGAAVELPEVKSPERVFDGFSPVRTVQSGNWERIECYRDSARPFVQEKYLEKSRHENSEVVLAFGSKFPATTDFLLHYGPKWNVNTGKVVVLVHGASDNATRAWAAPESLQGNAGTGGLLKALEDAGYRVFAVTFPHKHGNLFYEAQHLADAIEAARRITGEEKVSLVGHSAGGLAARVYVSDYRLGGDWTPYRNDVENLITLATPHRGQDFAFRHPEMNYFFIKDEMAANAPMSWDKTLYYGQWKDTFEFSIYSDNFPMQQQTLYDWSGRYPLNSASPDIHTTSQGGQGLVSHSLGLDNAVMKGGNFINDFRSYPVPADVKVTVIAGNNNKIENIPLTASEKDGPSDGLVFVESASHTADLTHPSREEPVRTVIVNENHVTIAYSPSVMGLITALLK